MITDINVLRRLIPTVTGKEISKYLQPIADAVSWFENSIVGKELMAKVIEGKDSENPPRLFELSQLVVAYKAYLDAIPKMDVMETLNGFVVVNDGSLAPASRERVAALIVSMSTSLNQAIDRLFEYLEDSAEYRTLWLAAPSCSIIENSFLSTLRLFRRYAKFDGGYSDFINSLYFMRCIIIKSIEPVISTELCDELLTQSAANSLTPANQRIIEHVRYAFAGYFNNDIQLGDISIRRARQIIETSIEDYPAFANSGIMPKKSELPTNNSIHVIM